MTSRMPFPAVCAVSALALLAGAPAAFAAEAPKAAPARPGPESRPSSVSEVVVTAEHKVEPGEVVGDVKPDIQLGPEDIATYGVTAITDLLDQLAPEIRSDAGRGGEGPAILINGHRISDFREIRNLPTEALLRVDILPEEAALKYGFSANQRVINFVLKPLYGSKVVDVTGGASTAGGAAAGQAGFTLTQIAHDNRLILNAKYNPQASLTEADRNVAPLTAGETFDLVGNITAATRDGEIDPALSALAGRPITIAGVPASAASRAPTLADFAPTAGLANATDVRRFRTLVPDTQKFSGDATFTRPIFADIRATVNGTFEATSTDSLRGLPGVSLALPAGDPFSPFSQAVQVDRFVAGFGPLRQNADTWQGHLGVSFNKQAGNWRLALTGNYDHTDSKNANDVGLDATALQAALALRTPGLNPFGPLPANLLTLRPQDTSHSKSDSGNLQFIAAGPILTLPTGKVFSSFRIGANGSEFTSQSTRLGLAQTTDFSRSGGNAQFSVDVPITSTRNHILEKFGDTSVNVHGAVQQASDFGTLTSYGYGLNWRPFSGLTVLISKDYDQGAPSQQQLGAPLLRTPNTRIFDFVTGQTVDVVQVSGGNAALTEDNRERTKLTLNWRPLPQASKKQLSIRADYNRIHIRNPIETFPAATAAIEAAFPDRFVRDADGQLTEIDYRPVNFTRADTSELRYGLDFSMPIGPVTQPPPRARGAAGMVRGLTIGGGPPEGGAEAGPDGGAPPAVFTGPPAGGRGAGGPAARGPGGGGGGRGGPNGGQAGQQDGRLRLAIFHTLHFENEQLIRPGGPLLDFLNGAALGNGGGQPQQELEVQLNIFERGYGGELSANWKSGSSVRGGAGPTSDLDFSSLATVRARIFVELDRRKTLIEKAPWLKGTRLTFSINNLFDQRISVHDGTGVTPLSFQPFYVEPIGRTWRVGVHKVFQ